MALPLLGFLFCSILYLYRPIEANDVWWHLASGRWILQFRQIPTVDVFSWTCFGNRWTDFEWLHQVMSYAAWDVGGTLGVTVLKIVVILGILGVTHIRLRRAGLDAIGCVAGLGWIFAGSRAGWTERPELWTLFFGAVTLSLLEDWRSGRRKGMHPLGWMLIFALWPNLHPAFVVGLGVMGLYFLEGLVARYQGVWRLGIGLGLGTLASLCTPNGVVLYKTVLNEARVVAQGVTLTEYAPPDLRSMEFFWLAVAATLFTFAKTFCNRLGSSYSWLKFGMAVIFLGASIRFVRYVPYFMVMAFPFVLQEIPAFREQVRGAAFRKPALITLLVGCFVYLSLKDSLPLRSGISQQGWIAAEAADFIVKAQLPQPLYNDYELGSSLVWRFNGTPGVFVDGRSQTVQGYTELIRELREAQGGEPQKWLAYLNKRGIETAIVQYPRGSSMPSIFEHYFPVKQWGLVYWDDTALIFVRRSPTHQPILNRYEFQMLRPDMQLDYFTQWLVSQSPAKRRQVREELLRNQTLHPHSQRTADLLAKT